MKIDIGAGAHPTPGFVRVDLNPRFADVIAPAHDLPFDDGSVTAMRAVDVLEHCSWRDTAAVLTEWARVCAPGATLYVQVPDAKTIMEWYVDGDPRLTAPPGIPRTSKLDLGACFLAGATWRLLGGHDDGERVDTAAGDDWRWNAHYALFSKASLTNALDLAGFWIDKLITNPFPNLCADAVRR